MESSGHKALSSMHLLITAGNDPDAGFNPLNNRFSFNHLAAFKKQTNINLCMG